MIFVTGDTHTDWMSRLNSDAFPEERTMTKDDYVIVCGDFGIWNGGKPRKINGSVFHLMCEHMHVNQKFPWDKTIAIFEQIIRIA